MKRFFSKFSVNKKIFIAYVPMLILFIIVGFYLYYSVLQVNAVKKICISRVSELEQISDKIDYIYQNIINISNVYLFDENIQDFLSYSENESEFERSQRYVQTSNVLTEQNSIFYNIPFYTTIYGFKDDAYISNSPYTSKEQDRNRVEKYSNIMKQPYSQLYWTNINDSKEDVILTATRYIYDSNNGQTLGMIFFDFEENLFSQTFSKSIQNNEAISLFWGNGEIISSSNSLIKENKDFEKTIFSKIDGFSNGYFYDDETKNLICFVKYSGLNLYIVKSEPYTDVVKSLSEPKTYLVIFILIIIVMFSLVTILLSHYISNPLKSLTKEVKNFHNKKIEKDMKNEKIKGDEIVYLREEYYKLQDRIDYLIKQTIEEQEKKRSYEMKALQNQINPHFLYNTLLSIRFLNRSGERKKIDKTIVSLIQLLSNLFEKDSSINTISEEIELLKDYVFIQQTRYGNNFEVEYDISDEVLNCTIDKLILQPIVENAIFHGISSYESGGLIQIKAFKENEKVKIIVKDNGVGIEKAEENSNKSIKIKHGIGVNNIRKRLDLMYANEYSLDMFSPQDGGTIVELIIPYNER